MEKNGSRVKRIIKNLGCFMEQVKIGILHERELGSLSDILKRAGREKNQGRT